MHILPERTHGIPEAVERLMLRKDRPERSVCLFLRRLLSPIFEPALPAVTTLTLQADA
jgi:hypothetical protein